jgi:hypothetical protein
MGTIATDLPSTRLSPHRNALDGPSFRTDATADATSRPTPPLIQHDIRRSGSWTLEHAFARRVRRLLPVGADLAGAAGTAPGW